MHSQVILLDDQNIEERTLVGAMAISKVAVVKYSARVT
jgi:hypothetical protein